MAIEEVPVTADSARERLIRAGERLFAEHGLTGVRLRELNALAGVRNDSAVHYYFGSREGLLEEIVLLHLADVSQRVDECTRLLCGGDEDASHTAIRNAIAALAIPFAEKLREERGRRFIQIMDQIYHGTIGVPEARYIRSSALAMNQIRRSLRGIPVDVLDERMRLVTNFVIASFAARTRASTDGGEQLDLDAFIVNLVDMATAAYLAPVPQPGDWPVNWPQVRVEALN